MRGPAKRSNVDALLLRRFEEEIKARVPHIIEGADGSTIANPTPLVDVTDALLECGRVEYGMRISMENVKVYGKLDSQIFGGSVKVRPAVEIIEESIKSGELRSGQAVFETTSGNFGLALGMVGKLGLKVIVLVSRKLQTGVADELKRDGAKLVNLDIDICPAPGLSINPNLVVARTVAANVRDQLGQFGLDLSQFDRSRTEVESLLAKQDVINLAKLLAKVYDGFCPEQYDNELNVRAHEMVTGPEIDLQLKAFGQSIGDYGIISAFGTGGTSTGLSTYLRNRYGRRLVHIVFPLNNQDVAGIRTKENALGLKFYRPELYAGQHEVDFEAARRTLKFFVRKGYDIGESSALALYACLQMLNYGVGGRFVVMLADGIRKYANTLATQIDITKRHEVSLREARASLADYGGVVWTHAAFVPREDGIRLIASSLGCEESTVKVATTGDVQMLLSTDKISESMKNLFSTDKPRLLLVCMVGGTSLRVAEMLATKGIEAESLIGGITGLPGASDKGPSDLIRFAAD